MTIAGDTLEIRVGGRPRSELLRLLSEAGVGLNAHAETLLARPDFDDPAARILCFVELNLRELGLPAGGTLPQLLSKAEERGLGPVPLLAGPDLRLALMAQANSPDSVLSAGRPPAGAVHLAPEPVSDDAEYPRGFYLRVVDRMAWLRGYRCDDTHAWGPDERFLFLLPDAEARSDGVRRAYSTRAEEYIDALGSVDALSPVDRTSIEAWATGVSGPIVDAGSGPGHWTAHLHRIGFAIEGIELVPEFVASASRRFPEVCFRQGDLASLPVEPGTLGGLLAWYSLIHFAPAQVPGVLAEFARCLRPGGSLLLACFEGERLAPFAHAVVKAYAWPVADLVGVLEGAGFAAVNIETRTDAGRRPHVAITAVLGT